MNNHARKAKQRTRKHHRTLTQSVRLRVEENLQRYADYKGEEQMKRQLWAIIDKKTNDLTGMVITAIHRAEVERIVEEALSNPKNLLRRYPQDFTMLKLAELTTGEEGVTLKSALNNDLGIDDAIDVAELATKIEINWHRAAQAEAAEKEEQEAYEKWVRQNGQPITPTAEAPKQSIFRKIFGGK